MVLPVMQDLNYSPPGVRRARNPPLGIFAEAAGLLFVYMKRRKSMTGRLKFSIHSHPQNSYLKPISAPELLVELTSKRALDLCKT